MEIASTTRLREKHKRSSDHGKIVLNIGNKIDSMFEESRESFEEEQIEVESPEPRAKNRLGKDEEEEDDIGDESFSVLGSIHNDSLQVINNHVPDQDHQIHHEKICPMEKCQRMQMDDFMNSLPSYMRASPFTHFEQTYEDYEACTPEQLDILKHRIEEKKKKERVTIDVIDENPLSSWTPSAAGVAIQTSYDGLTLPPCTCDDVRDESCEINQVYNNMIVAESWKANYLIWVLPTVLLIGLLSIFGVLALFFAIRLYAKLTCGRYREKTRMDGKTVIVTGCTSGIGKETAKELAKRGAKVIMACRSLDKAEKVKDDIIKSTNNPNVVVKKLDLSSFASIRSFAEDINNTEKTLDVLIHNAGYAETFRKEKSEDGIELTMATNHYGPFLLTHLLIDLLKKNSPSRIVIVASSLYRFASMDLDNPNPLTTLPGYLYYMSKEANILFTRELARRLEGTGVTANCLHPGMIDSGIWRNVPAPLSWGLALIIFCFFKTPFQGCQTSIMLAVDDKLSKVNGKYFSDCQESSLSSSASDMGRARKLWEISEKMVKLEEGDPKITV
ncbi:retinol dehydrogenase 14 isoform X2 [Bicyclus anynana]|nr:retinol dehydrogenase 14 isoform X2 [Bicyclus anynana]XP_052744951.1 retinol dehydrogenase 14 isoform X2 [Bicyclus anynana]